MGGKERTRRKQELSYSCHKTVAWGEQIGGRGNRPAVCRTEMGHNRSKELGHKTKPIREQCEEIRNVEL